MVHEGGEDPEAAAPAARHVFVVVFFSDVCVAERVALDDAAEAGDFVAVEWSVGVSGGGVGVLGCVVWCIVTEEADWRNGKFFASAAAECGEHRSVARGSPCLGGEDANELLREYVTSRPASGFQSGVTFQNFGLRLAHFRDGVAYQE